MFSPDWNGLKDFVEKHFPSYIPVPSQGDVKDYRLHTILCLMEPNQPSNDSKQRPRFYPIGEEDDLFKSGKSVSKPFVRPEVISERVWVFDNPHAIKSSTEAGAAVSECGGNIEKKNVSPSLSLGTISVHKVKYGDVNRWLKNRPLTDDIVKLAQEGKLWMIHDVIKAEKFDFKGENEDSNVTGEVFTPFGFGLKGKYGWSKSTSNLSRTEDFGGFSIGFKVSKLKARQVKPGKVKRSKVKSGSPSYYLKLEKVQYFNMPYTERNFYEPREPENGKFNCLHSVKITDIEAFKKKTILMSV
jgi:hypothetical protein